MFDQQETLFDILYFHQFYLAKSLNVISELGSLFVLKNLLRFVWLGEPAHVHMFFIFF